jgi:hypothetical protein
MIKNRDCKASEAAFDATRERGIIPGSCGSTALESLFFLLAVLETFALFR